MLLNWSKHINNNGKLYAIIAAAFLFILMLFTRIPEIDGQLNGLNIEDTKYFQSGKKVAEFFQISDFIEVKITPERVDAKTVFKSLDTIENNLNQLFKNIEVKSIHNAKRILINDIDSLAQIDSVLIRSKEIPIIQDLISNDKQSFLLIVTLDSLTEINVASFDSLLSKKYDGIKNIKSLSSLHVENEIKQSLTKDILIISITIFIFFTLFVTYVFRDIKSLIYTTIIIIISIVPTLFLFTVLKVPINLITALSIPIILVLSLADAVHILTGFFNNDKKNTNESIRYSMSSYIIPSFLTSLTTTIAFASFTLNSAESIQNFGIIVSCSVMPSFFLTYMVSPFILSFFTKKELADNGIKKLFRIINNYKKQLTYFLIIASIIAVPFMSKLKFNTDFDSFIPKGSETEMNRKEMTKDFNSQLSLTLLIEDYQGKKSKDIEKDIVKLVNELDTISTIGSIKSIKNQIDFKAKLGPFGKFLHFPNKNNPYRNSDRNKYRIELRLTDIKHIQATNQKLENILNSSYAQYDYHIYSKALLLDEINQNVAQSLFYSLLFSFVFIFFSILLLTKSILTTVISILVNIIPLSFIVLIFYFGNLDLNILTAITTVVCLGIIVDDTIHVIYRKKVLKLNNDELGYGIITTSIILIGGFLTFMLSSFQPSQVFGYVSAIIFCVTMIADLTLLPFLLDLTEKKKSTPFPLK